MAELEVIKHIKKTYTTMSNKEHSFGKKIKELIIEIGIIVFAISLSIWFHQWNEHRHEKKIVKEFLLGLKEDLKHDTTEMNNDIKSYLRQGKDFQYLFDRKLNAHFNTDSVPYKFRSLYGTTGLVPNSGRYEGFKSSGKMGLIEDPLLQNDLLDLYQELIPVLLRNTDGYNNNKLKLQDYLLEKEQRLGDSSTNLIRILETEKIHNYSNVLSYTNEIINNYQVCVEKAAKIIAAIEAKY